MSFTERTLTANGLAHHIIEWPGSKTPVLLCHGFLDIAWSWKWVAEKLAAAGHRVVAFDWRGHGETEWIGKGGYYHFIDYVLDLHELLPQLTDKKLHLVGHSMGGIAALMSAGTEPSRYATVSALEGLGPPASDAAAAVERARVWLTGVDKARAKEPRAMSSSSDVVARMRIQNPHIPNEVALFLAEKSTRAVEGGRAWTFDPLHRTSSPLPFRPDFFASYLSQLDMPTLLIFGEKGYRLADEKERVALCKNARVVELPGVGHMMHWEAPDAIAAHLLALFSEP